MTGRTWRRVARLPAAVVGLLVGCASHPAQPGFPPPAVRYHPQAVGWRLVTVADRTLILRYAPPPCAMTAAETTTHEDARSVTVTLTVMVSTGRPCPPGRPSADVTIRLSAPLGRRSLKDGSRAAGR